MSHYALFQSTALSRLQEQSGFSFCVYMLVTHLHGQFYSKDDCERQHHDVYYFPFLKGNVAVTGDDLGNTNDLDSESLVVDYK